ncbi:PadR family transcriptional regulator [Ruminococcaceae bacterium OttesenSCG-928-A16]|nr:PadR family transcriptional regulator [Ruminococcaceae bacterium OttesenSCG-928-A16]
MERYEQQFKKGVLELMILKLISVEKTYGYDLITKLKRNSNGLFCLKEGTLYPLLYRLEGDGLICSTEEVLAGSNKRKKKYYEITELGRETLDGLIDYWDSFSGHVNKILQLGD